MARKQDSVALETFVAKRQDLLALANAIVQNRAVAEELVQDSWVHWSRKSYPDDKAAPILKRIVLNLAKDWYRRQRVEWSKLEAYTLLRDNAPDTERVVIARQDLLDVIGALAQLPERTLKAFRLSRIDGLTYAQIAKRLGVAESTAFGLVADALVKVTLDAGK